MNAATGTTTLMLLLLLLLLLLQCDVRGQLGIVESSSYFYRASCSVLVMYLVGITHY